MGQNTSVGQPLAAAKSLRLRRILDGSFVKMSLASRSDGRTWGGIMLTCPSACSLPPPRLSGFESRQRFIEDASDSFRTRYLILLLGNKGIEAGEMIRH